MGFVCIVCIFRIVYSVDGAFEMARNAADFPNLATHSKQELALAVASWVVWPPDWRWVPASWRPKLLVATSWADTAVSRHRRTFLAATIAMSPLRRKPMRTSVQF